VDAKTGGLWQARMLILSGAEGFYISYIEESKYEQRHGSGANNTTTQRHHLFGLLAESPSILWPLCV
jgi:hypothetical protein